MTRRITEHARTAKAIRAELKTAFPATRFSVTSESFSMGNAVRIGWIDGPTAKDVAAIARKYQYGHFNGMIDLYEHSNSRDDIPQVKYVSIQRHFSQDAQQAAAAEIAAAYGWEITYDPERGYVNTTSGDRIDWDQSGTIWRLLQDRAL